MMRSSVTLILMFVFAANIFAEDNSNSDTTKTYSLDPVTVTATRTSVVRSVVAPSISIISQNALEANQQKSVFSLISQQVPGVFVQERGILGFGVTTSSAGQVSIRGVGGNPTTGVLMLIDGQPQYMGIFGHPIADNYLSANAERIEVIRGPASVLYGSNAMGGVINIITHSSQKPGISGDVSLSYGSYNSQHIGGKFGYQSGDWNTTGSFTHEHTDGHRPQSEFDANSGYLKTSGRINEQFVVTVDGSLTKFKTYDPGKITAPLTNNNYIDIQRGYAGVSVDNDLGISKGAARFIYNFGHHQVFDGSDWISDDYHAVFNVYQTLKLIPNNAITAGIDFSKFGGEGKNNSKDYGAPSMYEYAFYANIQQTLEEQLTLTGGLRYNYNEEFGDIYIPQFGAAYNFNNGTTVRGSISKGYRSPTIAELYLFAPTPILQPENLWNYEIGVSHTFYGRITTELVGYVSEGDNLIRMVAYRPGGRENSGSFIHRGVEFSGSAFISNDLNVYTSYSYIDAGKETRSVPKHKFFIGGEYNYCKTASFSLSIQHIEGMYGSDNSKDPLGDYTNIGAKVCARVLPQLSVNLSVENVLDEEYQTILGYPMPGRTLTLGIKTFL